MNKTGRGLAPGAQQTWDGWVCEMETTEYRCICSDENHHKIHFKHSSAI